jgi:hypothetical protein
MSIVDHCQETKKKQNSPNALSLLEALLLSAMLELLSLIRCRAALERQLPLMPGLLCILLLQIRTGVLRV